MTRVFTDSMFICHFVDSDLGVENFFEKEKAGRIKGLRKISCRNCLLSYCFLGNKERISFKSSLEQ